MRANRETGRSPQAPLCLLLAVRLAQDSQSLGFSVFRGLVSLDAFASWCSKLHQALARIAHWCPHGRH